MESLKKDRTTLLYFYQQVKDKISMPRVLLYLKCQVLAISPRRWKDKALEVPVYETSLGVIPWPLISCPTLLLPQLIKRQLAPPHMLTSLLGLS